MLNINKEEYDKAIGPIDQIIKDAQPKVKEAVVSDIVNSRAIKEPLPNNIEEALLPELNGIVFLENGNQYSVRPMVALDIAIFKLLDNPIYKHIMGELVDSPETKKAMVDEQFMFNTVYQFTHPAINAYKLLKRSKDDYEMAAVELATEYTTKDIISLMSVIWQVILKSQKSNVSFTAKDNNESDVVEVNNNSVSVKKKD